MITSPIEIFKQGYEQELKRTKVRISSACCLSTLGIDGFPNARFVSLKDVVENNFIVTGSLKSRKGIEINFNSKVALTFWRTKTEKQVRIQGNATKIENELADKYFAERSRNSQIVSMLSNQGQPLNNISTLNRKYQEIETTFSNRHLTRPENCGGYFIIPIRIEFMEFKPNRFHERNLYELINEQWRHLSLQP